MSFNTWTKKHTERLYDLLDESVINPLNKDDEHFTDVFNHLEEDDLMKGVGVTKFRKHAKEKSNDWMMENSLKGIRLSELVEVLFLCSCFLPLVRITIFLDDLTPSEISISAI